MPDQAAHLSSDPVESETRYGSFADRHARLRDLAAAQAAGEVAVSDIVRMESALFGANAVVDLLHHRNQPAANAALRRTAAWFEFPHPQGKDLRGEVDFAALKLCQAWHLLASEPNGPSALEPATRDAIRVFFLRHDFASIYQSENHGLMFHAARHLMGQAWPDDRFAAYDRTGADLATGDARWLCQFIRHRARFGWGEFDSACYQVVVWEILLHLHALSGDAILRRLAGMMLDLVLAGMSVNSHNGMYCGAHGRIYPNHAIDHATEPTRAIQYLYIGYSPIPSRLTLHDLLTARPGRPPLWEPSPAVRRLLSDRASCRTPFDNRERRHLHNVADLLPVEPLPGSIRKYGHATSRWLLGCVQYQDGYPPAAACPTHNHYELPVPADQRNTPGYAHHQQHEWDLSFFTRPDARLFTHHPGSDGASNHWTGDRLCGCGHFFQNRQALVALYDIPPSQPFRFVHAYVPVAAFDEVIGSPAGWLFVRAGEAFAGLRLLSESAPRWTTEGTWAGREIIADGLRHGVVCEAGDTTTHPDFDAFRREVEANAIHFDPVAMTLAYRSRQAGLLEIDTRALRRLDGRSISLDYPLYDSPYLRAGWGAGVVSLGRAEYRTNLDFNV